MKTITIEVPESSNERAATLTVLRQKLAAVNAEKEAILGAIRAIQKTCSHPNAYRGTDIGGGPDGHCNDCGYSW